MDRKTLAALAAFGLAALGSAGCGDNGTALTGANETAAGAPTALASPSRLPSASTTTVGSSAMGIGAVSGDVVQTTLNDPRFSTLAEAIQAAGLAQTLKGAGPYTIFAPTNDAFNKLPPGTLENLLRPENKARLASLLRYHVLPSRVTAADARALDSGTSVKTLGGSLNVIRNGDSVMVGNAQIVQADIPATNGVLHVIDAVLVPGDEDAGAETSGGGSTRTLGGAPAATGGSGGGTTVSGAASGRTAGASGGPSSRTLAPPPGAGGYGAPTANGAGRVPGRSAGTGSGIGATAPGGGAAEVSGPAAGSGPTGASNAGGGY